VRTVQEKDIERIKQIIDEVKPQYTVFGGDVEFLDIKDDMVRLKVEGYCYR
jgi:Fe-S cluster biogenesis protein NfuA